MALELRQQVKLSQQLVMTPQLQMAIRLLQLNRMELAEHISQELMENPVLEETLERPSRDELEANPYEQTATPEAPVTGEAGEGMNDFDWQTYFESYNMESGAPRIASALDDETRDFLQNSITRPESLSEHLLWQIRMGDFDDFARNIAAYIVGNLNGEGFLDASPEEICETCECTPEQAEAVRAKIRLMDPAGVGSRTLEECLLSQLEVVGEKGGLAWEILTEYRELLEAKKFKQIARKTRRSLEEVKNAVDLLRGLESSPARAFPEMETQYVVPDLYVIKVGDEYVITQNEDGLPKLKVSNYYKKALSNGAGEGGGAAKEYIQEKMKSALWLIKSIHQRQRTIYRVMESILKYQREFFDYGIEYLKPLVLRDIAEDIEMHESTVSRVTSNKYVHTPRGIFPLKYFFNSGISTTSGGSVASESVKDKIKQLVGSEPPHKPYTDIQLVELLRRQGIDISRRTVTKYRESLGISSSSKRKQSA
ncbi:MAG: RNA polymerase factor sigma-54 [Chrysiogenetes bacterium]|nr:RNA polymerase factor sigma-54 [Chrysiogenetes bacterium]